MGETSYKQDEDEFTEDIDDLDLDWLIFYFFYF